jgi:hypothetical protein
VICPLGLLLLHRYFRGAADNRPAHPKQEGPKLQAQQALVIPRWSVSTLIAVVATLVAAALALALVVTAERPATLAAPTVVPLYRVGAEQIAHNRSEEGLGASSSVGGEQIAHNRSEEGLGASSSVGGEQIAYGTKYQKD